MVPRVAFSDDAVAGTLKGGDARAFEAAVDRYQAPLLAYARGILGGAHPDAEDAVQDALMRTFSLLRRDRGRELIVKPWLYTIVHNLCINQLTRSRPTVDIAPHVCVLPGHTDDPHERAVAGERLRVVVGGLLSLPERQRAALVMQAFEGRSHADVAARLGTSVAGTKALVVRARAGLAQSTRAA